MKIFGKNRRKVFYTGIFAVVALCIASFASQSFNVGRFFGIKAVAVVPTLANAQDKVIPATLLGKAELGYAGGTKERDKNIELGVSHIDGTVVAPGEEFSFTKALGSVTEADGYKEAKVFLNGEVAQGLGGGLCQVSTILFRSILSAGLPVTERHNHSYTVSYYDVGLDATFSDPGLDLKFLNDTKYPLTIHGRTEDEKAIFEIYGVSDGRQASTSEPEISEIVNISPTKYIATTTREKGEPECVNAPQIGYTAKVNYGIVYTTGEYKEQVFTSVYKPLQKICYFDILSATSTSPMVNGM